MSATRGPFPFLRPSLLRTAAPRCCHSRVLVSLSVSSSRNPLESRRTRAQPPTTRVRCVPTACWSFYIASTDPESYLLYVLVPALFCCCKNLGVPSVLRYTSSLQASYPPVTGYPALFFFGNFFDSTSSEEQLARSRNSYDFEESSLSPSVLKPCAKHVAEHRYFSPDGVRRTCSPQCASSHCTTACILLPLRNASRPGTFVDASTNP